MANVLLNKKDGSIPKYCQIKEYIIEMINSGKYSPGEKLPSESQFSKMFKVNQNTVKKTLRELVLQNYIYREQGRGSFVKLKESKESSTKRTFAVFVNDVNDPFYSIIVDILSKISNSMNNHLLLCGTEGKFDILKKTILDLYKQNKIDGLIISPISLSKNPEEYCLYEYLHRQGIPMVLLFPQKGMEFVDSIAIDHENMTFDGIKYILDSGCKDIGIVIHGDFEDISISKKLKGYREALAQRGMVYDEKRLYIVKEASFGCGYKLGEALSKEDSPPGALFCMTDALASGIERKFLECGTDLLNKIEMYFIANIHSHYYLKGTMVEYDVEYICKKAVELLYEQIEDEGRTPGCYYAPYIIKECNIG